MYEASINDIDQQDLKNTENDIVQKNTSSLYHNSNKIIICFLFIMLIIVILLLIIINIFFAKEIQYDYNIRALYYCYGGIITFYRNIPISNNTKIWINGKSIPSDTTSFYCSQEFEVLFKIDVSNYTSLQGMFKDTYITEISFSPDFNTTNIEDMSYLFSGCHRLKSIDIKHFDTRNVVNMVRMFSGPNHLTSLKITNFNTEKVTYMTEMFYYLYYLEKVDISSFTIADINDNFDLFSGLTLSGTLTVKREYVNKIKTIPSKWRIIPVD